MRWPSPSYNRQNWIMDYYSFHDYQDYNYQYDGLEDQTGPSSWAPQQDWDYSPGTVTEY